MSEQAEKLLAQWENQHIEVVPRSDRKDQAQRLALRCREDAAKGGISSKDLVDIHANADAGPRQSGHDQPPVFGPLDNPPRKRQPFRTQL
jgi:hypothetical protein